MTPTLQALTTLLPVLYLLTTFFYGMELGGPRAPRATRCRHVCSTMLVVAHLAWMYSAWSTLGHLPVVDLWSTVSFAALCVVLVYLPVEWITGAPTTGVFVVGAAFLAQLVASCFARAPEYSANSASPFFAIHVVTIVLAVAALLLSGFFGALYLMLLRQIRSRRFGVLFERLPDLESLSKLNRGSAGLGFILLTAGLNIGIWWAHEGAAKGVDYSDPKILSVLVLWVVFGLIGSSRWLGFLSGRRAAILASTAAALLVLAVVVSFLPLGSIHES